MKFIAVLILSIVSCEAFYDQCSGSYMQQVLLKCVGDSGVSYDDLSDFLTSKYAKSDKAKCYRACVFQKCKYLTPDGRFYKDLPKRMGQLLHGGITSGTPTIEKAANYCIHHTGRFGSVCDTTEAFVQCFIKKSPIPLLIQGVF